jgi:hypothetical protein
MKATYRSPDYSTCLFRKRKRDQQHVAAITVRKETIHVILGARSFGQTQRRYSNPADFVVLSRRSSFDENKARYQSRHALGKEKALMSDEYENPFIGVSNQAIIESLSGARRRSPGDPTRSDPALGAKLAFDSSGFFIWTSCLVAPVCRASAIWLMVLSLKQFWALRP